MNVREIELSAGTIEYTDTGGDGPVIVLLHGLLMDATLWDNVIGGLASPRRVWGGEPAGAACMAAALDADAPVTVPVSIQISTLGVPRVSAALLDEVRGRVSGMMRVTDEQSLQAAVTLIEQAQVWAKPAAG